MVAKADHETATSHLSGSFQLFHAAAVVAWNTGFPAGRSPPAIDGRAAAPWITRLLSNSPFMITDLSGYGAERTGQDRRNTHQVFMDRGSIHVDSVSRLPCQAARLRAHEFVEARGHSHLAVSVRTSLKRCITRIERAFGG